MSEFIELPCKIGDKLWCINDYNEVEEVKCLGFIIGENLISIVYKEEYADDEYNLPLNSGLLFLSKSEAENKLGV